MEWKTRIGELILIKEGLHRVDPAGPWEYTLPEVAASESALRAAEGTIHECFDPQHRAFLACAGGWRAFYQAVDLFGTAEFLQANAVSGARWTRAQEFLSYLARDGALDDSRLVVDDLLPIAVSARDIDVFAIGRASSAFRGHVFWFAKYEIERFPTFEDYFLAMIEYNRLEFEDARARVGPVH